MRQEQLILSMRYVINTLDFGEHSFIHLVSAMALSQKLKNEILQFALEHLALTGFRSFVGKWDFIFETHHERSDEVSYFIRDLYARFPNEIAKRESLQVLTLTKTSVCTTIEEAAA